MGREDDRSGEETVFSQVATLTAPVLTRALAVDPMGRWLVILNGRTATLGDSLHVYDLSTRSQARNAFHLDGVSAVAVSGDGQMAVVVGEGLFEAVAFSLPGLQELFRAEARDGSQIIRNSEGTAYFVGGSFGTYRLTTSGAVMPDTLGLREVAALALNADEQTLLAITAFPGGRTLHALDARDLRRQALIHLSFTASVLVPLADPKEVLVLGTTDEHPFRGPIVSSVVNWVNGIIESVEEIARGTEVVYFGVADPWIRIGPSTVLVVSSYGAIEVNTVTGEARLLESTVFEGGSPCCAITYDPIRQQVLAAKRRVNFEVGGPVVVYKREP